MIIRPETLVRWHRAGFLRYWRWKSLRHDADDSCPIGPDGRRQHTYDYREGGCRQVRNAEVSANLGWAMPGTGSAMVMRRG
jgi:hypothetical protein